MLSIKINLDDSNIKEKLDQISESLADSESINLTVAGATEEKLKENLEQNYVPRNKRGDFWKRVHDSVEAHADDTRALLLLTELGIRLRVEGGEVTPGKNPAAAGPRKGLPTKALAIPSDAVPVVSGRQLPPAAAGLLAYLSGSGGESTGYLVEGELAKRKRNTKRGKKGSEYVKAKAGGSLMYTLRSITRHNPDDNIIKEDDLESSAVEALLDYLNSFDE